MKLQYIYIAALCIWLSGLAGFNVYHHEEMPDIFKYEIVSHYQLSDQFPFYGKRYDITLTDEIGAPQAYRNVASVLQEAGRSDTVIFHIFGYGGRIDATNYIINNVKLSKAHIIMSVEASAYSGDAYLAAAGDELKMAPATFLMYHFSSILNDDCSTETGTDRGVPNIEHCEINKANEIAIGVQLIEEIPILTPEEKAEIYTGHDVYLQANEVERRLKAQ